MKRKQFRYAKHYFYWLKQDLIRWLRLDTAEGFLGIIMLLSGLALLTTLALGFAQIFRSLFPWVHGANISAVYWQSIRFGLAAGGLLMVFVTVSVVLIVTRWYSKK